MDELIKACRKFIAQIVPSGDERFYDIDPQDLQEFCAVVESAQQARAADTTEEGDSVTKFKRRIKTQRGANKKKSSKKDEQLYGELVALMFEKFLRSILQELGYAVRTKPLADGVVEHAANLTMEYLKQGG